MGESKAPYHHYDLRSLAKSLKLASIDVIKTSNMDIESHWYRSVGPADLYFWKSRNRIVKVQVSLYYQVIEWNEYDGVKTGYVNDDAVAGKGEMIHFDQKVNASVVSQAIEFLNSVNSIDQSIVSKFIENYKRGPIFSPMAKIRRFFYLLLRKL